MKQEIIKFIKSKDFKFVEELGRGACGKTVKLYDEVIGEYFVCKKYEPFNHEYKKELFDNFIHEIKLLYLLNHKNVVRVFNYYIYPTQHTGYIIMECIDGTDIESYLSSKPEDINNIFTQCISGFHHLEKCNVLHRDIRPQNILVSEGGELKIIDFGFGKRASNKKDFDKSISLNWWCEPPEDFKIKEYSFCTEVYFVGKLFEKIIKEMDVSTFKYSPILSNMCNPNPHLRINSFSEINSSIIENKFVEVEFNDFELKTYRNFSQNLERSISKIEDSCKYFDDADLIQKKLEDCYRSIMLEHYAPTNNTVAGCFLNGSYYYRRDKFFPVTEIKAFIEFIRSCSKDKKNIVISNLCSKLDSIQRYSEPYEDIPF